MKELSIEEKARRYDEAIERAKKLYEQGTITESLSYVFPEIKESEDEKVRNILIKFFEDWHKTRSHCWGISLPKILAWLEKQGEQKPAFGMKTPEESLGIDSETYNKIVDECIYGEQKPTDKVEPKFKVEKDKWYVCTSQYCNCIEGRNYKASLDGRIIDDYGTEYDMHDDTYRWFRPWTIQDAKDGDVLAMSYASRNYIQIYKRLYAEGFKTIMSVYCFYRVEEDTYYDETDSFHVMNSGEIITPATKEQRDTLLKAMADTGYTFDFEKKELKKIEQSPIDVRTTGYWHVEDVEQNHAWSEEDKAHINSLLKRLEGMCKPGATFTSTGFAISEDEDWLKSLRPQNRWKPSDEQMDGLKEAIEFLGCTKTRREQLQSLYEQLKKLKG